MNPRILDRAGVGLLFLMTACGVVLLGFLLLWVFLQGGAALSLDFLIQESRGFGVSGGVFYQILGTVLLMAGAVVVGLPLALAGALWQTEYLKSAGLKTFFRQMIDSLNSVPTILFGLLGYLLFGIILGAGVSWLTGVLILAVMIGPTLQVSILEAIEAMPVKYRDSGSALGLNTWQQITSILLPHCRYAIVTGVLLGLARAAGETAAIMFTATAFSGARFPTTWTDPVPTLQTHILVLAQEAVSPEAIQNAWGAGLVLLGLVFLLNALSLWLRGRLSMEFDR